jgi:hypothetical protein
MRCEGDVDVEHVLREVVEEPRIGARVSRQGCVSLGVVERRDPVASLLDEDDRVRLEDERLLVALVLDDEAECQVARPSRRVGTELVVCRGSMGLDVREPGCVVQRRHGDPRRRHREDGDAARDRVGGLRDRNQAVGLGLRGAPWEKGKAEKDNGDRFQEPERQEPRRPGRVEPKGTMPEGWELKRTKSEERKSSRCHCAESITLDGPRRPGKPTWRRRQGLECLGCEGTRSLPENPRAIAHDDSQSSTAGTQFPVLKVQTGPCVVPPALVSSTRQKYVF